MAVANHFTFGNINTNDYDVVVEGYGNYTAPKRAVEMVSVPGRNGAVIIDQGYYENGEATFKCVIKARTQHEFQRKVSAFRNAITSQLGYQRLTEGYQADEYRMASYSGGLDDEPEFIGRAGKFEVNFTCKPQRYLLPGESSIAVSSGDTLYNPTPYDASPLLAVEGYGTIGFNGYEIELSQGLYGTIEIAKAKALPVNMTIDTSQFNDGDEITILPFSLVWHWSMTSAMQSYRFYSTPNVTTQSGEGITSYTSGSGSRNIYFRTEFEPITFNSNEDYSNTTTAVITVLVDTTGQEYKPTIEADIAITIEYDSATNTFSVSQSFTKTGSDNVPFACDNPSWKGAVVNSTKSYLSGTTYIDCDLGDAYKIENGSYISLNSYIDLGSDLPTLASGTNEITFDNTITSLEVTPRYWIL